jgi:LmbE family N-acetylglucosaminyl deacetylase
MRVAVVVAHPDDETLWAGGLLLSHPEWSTFIVTLCRGEDPDRSGRFRALLRNFGAQGAMGTLDDGVDQHPLAPMEVQQAILSLLPRREYDLLLTHAPQGEYTWHRRHGEVSLAMHALWREGQLRAARLWEFAYEDGGGAYAPRAREDASLRIHLVESIWERKLQAITRTYGFQASSWEARAVARTEGFTCFTDPPVQASLAWSGLLEHP